MNARLVLSLSSVLYKSYLRASQKRAKLSYITPRLMLIINFIAFTATAMVVYIALTRAPEKFVQLVAPFVGQAVISLPLFMTSFIILAGVLFELGYGGLSSTDTVNWLPITPKEFVLASSVSMISTYSPIFSVGAGLTLGLAAAFRLVGVWVPMVLLAATSLFLGAFIVEILRAAMSKFSSGMYKRSGRLAIVIRLVLVIVLFVIVQLLFNPNILSLALSSIVAGVGTFWFLPMLWPSLAVINLLNHRLVLSSIFSALSVLFTIALLSVASTLRLKYWSPAPVAIVISKTAVYSPRSMSLATFRIDPMTLALALKDFRSLVRRKELSRFISIPIFLIVAYSLPFLFSPKGFYMPSTFFVLIICFMTSNMFSSISVGQEGKSVINLYLLPIGPKQLALGKLIPPLSISILTSMAALIVFQILSPSPINFFFLLFILVVLLSLALCFFGLGVGARYPDYSSTGRGRYVTFKGFIVLFGLGIAMLLALSAPLILYTISNF